MLARATPSRFGPLALCCCVFGLIGCRVDTPIGPATYGALGGTGLTDAGISSGKDSQAFFDTNVSADTPPSPDVPGPLCPGNLGCPCGSAKDCAVGACLSVNGNNLACVDPCALAVPPTETCNGLDDDCDGQTDEQVCDDGNPCTDDGCGSAGCSHSANSAACNDGDACTLNDHCAAGTCSGGGGVVCDDKNACTTDACVPAVGCAFTLSSAACSDGNLCTLGDTCAKGICQSGPPLACVDNNPCTEDACAPATGCTFANNGKPCDDGNSCTNQDACKGGSCQAGIPAPCDDGNPCTTDSCGNGACTSTANSLPCNDGDVCSYSDTCSNGSCAAGPALACNDGNPCTTDTCDAKTGCIFQTSSLPCDDGSPCTVGDVCANGACHGGQALNCDDGNACTLDACAPQTGCGHTSSNLPCDDGNACTSQDTCHAGGCKGVATVCDDFNLCTTDACDSQKGCFGVANALGCDDSSACTTSDHCLDGTCTGATLLCDDKNPCTLDTCNGKLGCVHTALPDGSACGDIGVCQSGSGQCAWGSDIQPAVSCLQIHQTWPTAKTGTYWLDPDGAGSGTAYQVQCDMDAYGGGWLRIDNAWANKLLLMSNPSPTQGKCVMTGNELRAWDGFDGAPGYGHMCVATRPSGNWMAYSELRFEGIVLTGYSPNGKNTYDLTMDCYGMQHLGAFCAGPNDALQPPYDSNASVSNGQTVGPLFKLVNLGQTWADFEIRAHEEGPQLEGIVWNAGAYLLR